MFNPFESCYAIVNVILVDAQVGAQHEPFFIRHAFVPHFRFFFVVFCFYICFCFLVALMRYRQSDREMKDMVSDSFMFYGAPALKSVGGLKRETVCRCCVVRRSKRLLAIFFFLI